MHVCIGLGADLGELSIGIFLVFLVDIDLSILADMKLVNDTIELIHDPRFYQKMFC